MSNYYRTKWFVYKKCYIPYLTSFFVRFLVMFEKYEYSLSSMDKVTAHTNTYYCYTLLQTHIKEKH